MDYAGEAIGQPTASLRTLEQLPRQYQGYGCRRRSSSQGKGRFRLLEWDNIVLIEGGSMAISWSDRSRP